MQVMSREYEKKRSYLGIPSGLSNGRNSSLEDGPYGTQMGKVVSRYPRKPAPFRLRGPADREGSLFGLRAACVCFCRQGFSRGRGEAFCYPCC